VDGSSDVCVVVVGEFKKNKSGQILHLTRRQFHVRTCGQNREGKRVGGESRNTLQTQNTNNLSIARHGYPSERGKAKCDEGYFVCEVMCVYCLVAKNAVAKAAATTKTDGMVLKAADAGHEDT